MQISALLLTLGVSGALAGRPVLGVPQAVSSSTKTTSSTTAARGRPVLGAPAVTSSSKPAGNIATPTPTTLKTSTSSRSTTSTTTISSSSTSSRPTTTSTTSRSTTSTTTTSSRSTTSTTTTSSRSTTTSTTSRSTTTLSTTSKVTTTSTTPAAVASTCSSPLPTYGCLPLTTQSVFVNAMLDQHNTYRMRHSAPNMTWSNALVPAALANAQNNADKNVFVHTTNPQWGENIAYQYGYNNPLYLPFLWYDEVRKYDFSNPGFSAATGHFTQQVWLDSTQLGCAYVQAKNGLSNNGWYYLSCEYNSPGNYAGEYQAKVLPANSQPYPAQPAQYI